MLLVVSSFNNRTLVYDNVPNLQKKYADFGKDWSNDFREDVEGRVKKATAPRSASSGPES